MSFLECMPLIAPPAAESTRKTTYEAWPATKMSYSYSTPTNYKQYSYYFSGTDDDAIVYALTNSMLFYLPASKTITIPIPMLCPTGWKVSKQVTGSSTDSLLLVPFLTSEVSNKLYTPKDVNIPYFIYDFVDLTRTDFASDIKTLATAGMSAYITTNHGGSVDSWYTNDFLKSTPLYVQGGTKVAHAKSTSAGQYSFYFLFPNHSTDVDLQISDLAIEGFFRYRELTPSTYGSSYAHLSGHPMIALALGITSGSSAIDIRTSPNIGKYKKQTTPYGLQTLDFDTYPATMTMQKLFTSADRATLHSSLDYLTHDDAGHAVQQITVNNPDGATLYLDNYSSLGYNVSETGTFSDASKDIVFSCKSSAASGTLEIKQQLGGSPAATDPVRYKLKLEPFDFVQIPLRVYKTASYISATATSPAHTVDLEATTSRGLRVFDALFSDSKMYGVQDILGKYANVYFYPDTSGLSGDYDEYRFNSDVGPYIYTFDAPADATSTTKGTYFDLVTNTSSSGFTYGIYAAWGQRRYHLSKAQFLTYATRALSPLSASDQATISNAVRGISSVNWNIWAKTLDVGILKTLLQAASGSSICDTIVDALNISKLAVTLIGLTDRNSTPVDITCIVPVFDSVGGYGKAFTHEICHRLAYEVIAAEEANFNHADSTGDDYLPNNLMASAPADKIPTSYDYEGMVRDMALLSYNQCQILNKAAKVV